MNDSPTTAAGKPVRMAILTLATGARQEITLPIEPDEERVAGLFVHGSKALGRVATQLAVRISQPELGQQRGRPRAAAAARTARAGQPRRPLPPQSRPLRSSRTAPAWGRPAVTA